MTSAIGLDAERIYEELRAHVWRSRTQGALKMLAEVREGRLSSNMCRKSIAKSLGLSVRTVQRRLDFLREIGWVRSDNGHRTGEALVYQLGVKGPGGTEVFFADVDCREFYISLEERASQEELPSVSRLSEDTRIELAKEWISRENRDLNGVMPQSHIPCATEALKQRGDVPQGHLVIDNPFGGIINKSEKYMGRSAPNKNSGTSKSTQRQAKKPPDSGLEDEKEITTSALDTGSDRLAAAEKVADTAAEESDIQIDKNRIKRERRKRVDGSLKDLSRKDQNRANLRGGTSKTNSTRKAARNLWDLYEELIHEIDESAPVAPFNADGNEKARGQLYNLIGMYGEATIALTLRYAFRNWEPITKRLFKKETGLPNISLIVAMHDTLVREAAIWSKHRGVFDEWDDWSRDNPALRPPAAMRERYADACKELKALGL